MYGFVENVLGQSENTVFSVKEEFAANEIVFLEGVAHARALRTRACCLL
jgi:hypothetical protein